MKHLSKKLLTAILTLLCSMAPAVAGDYTSLPDTGIETCYDGDGYEIVCPSPGEPFYGQDAQYDSSKMAFEDNGDGTVTDLNTGLMWQQRDDGTEKTWQAACDYCDSLGLAGYTDWRIPDRRELFSIVDLGRYNPAIDTDYFFDTKGDVYWSGSTYAVYTDYAWGVNFTSGSVSYFSKTYDDYVRCVRSGS
ncbi:exported hypothetical protein [Desulfamplus magnetovallimortis]|uniref:Lcl C-terminal domain-containing protein n=1 Tax=Desulfamplus magnetovallimortis TaxID=1246637 RepID=A0A1W1H7V2_9BACT|nr:DUF1566 domain-containing protein [Desulfamplus magnetovallimortis]SLM28552.1 exported hypothetical protein [Desulfamplus magnetovallimortis]